MGNPGNPWRPPARSLRSRGALSDKLADDVGLLPCATQDRVECEACSTHVLRDGGEPDCVLGRDLEEVEAVPREFWESEGEPGEEVESFEVDASELELVQGEVALLDHYADAVTDAREVLADELAGHGYDVDPVPSQFKEALLCLGEDPEEARCYLDGFRGFESNGRRVWVPEVVAGKLNPAGRFASVRASASRYVQKLQRLPESDYLEVDPELSADAPGPVFTEGTRKLYLYGLDLTFPKSFSEGWLTDQEDREEVAESCLRALISRLKSMLPEGLAVFSEEDVKLGVSRNLHTWATKTPLSPHLHFHVNFPNVALIDGDLVRWTPKTGDGYALDADDVREMWREVLAEHGVEVGDSSNIHLQLMPLDKKGKLLNRIKYCARKPVTDLWTYFRNSSQELTERDLGMVRKLLDHDNRRVNYGFMTYLSRLIPQVGEVEEDPTDPLTGEEAEALGFIPAESMAEMLASGSCKLLRWDPGRKRYFQSRRPPP